MAPYRRHGSGEQPRPWWFAAVALLLAAGIGWMHSVAASPTPAVTGPVVTAKVGMQTRDTPQPVPCPAPGQDGGHAGSMCQAPALQGAPFTAPASSALAVVRPWVGLVLLDTIAVEAGRGSGCGPPSLEMLSVRRT